MAIDISVVVPIYNAQEDTKLLLNSLVKNYDFKNNEVLLINDCSNAETSDYLRNFVLADNRFKLEENKTNLGFVKTCNKGIQMAKGEIVVLLNSDTIIPSGFCKKIKKCFKSNTQIGTASPISSNSCDYYIKLPQNQTTEQMNKLLNKKHECIYPQIPAAEGFCFCIRKSITKKIGFLDEIFGKGYHEEVDFSYRALANGWISVLIDDLYVYHKGCSSFGTDQKKKQIESNNNVFNERWKNFKDATELVFLLENPIKTIEEDLFSKASFIEQVKKNAQKFLLEKTAKSIKFVDKKGKQIQNKTATIFAMYDKTYRIPKSTIKYLNALKSHSDYLIVVADNKILPTELSKIKDIADAYIFQKHGEYGFGSYKIGFNTLKDLSLFNDLEQIIFCNDSVILQTENIDKIIKEQQAKDFYGITQNYYGFEVCNKTKLSVWTKSPHIQSYYFAVSKNVFMNNAFNKFINSIKKENHKNFVISKYEIKLSKILTNEGFKIETFYPPIVNEKNIAGYYLHPTGEYSGLKLFIKKRYYNAKLDGNTIRQLVGKQRVLFWGASKALSELLKVDNLCDLNIIGIVDKNRENQGKFIGEYPIYHSSQIHQLQAECVLMTIVNNNNKIYQELQKEFETNYKNVKLLPNLIEVQTYDF